MTPVNRQGPRHDLVVVQVEDQVNQSLAGRQGVRYESPPQPREQALALIEVLLGHPGEEVRVGDRWSCPVAGGRRTVALQPLHRSGDETKSAEG